MRPSRVNAPLAPTRIRVDNNAMLHIAKLAVGVRDPAHLRELQHERSSREPALCHRTRHAPRRRAEITRAGSLYWVIGGAMLVRQRITNITDDAYDDGSPCAALILDPALVAVEPRIVRPFQGWRYLQPGAAPPDLAESSVPTAALPQHLMRDLRALCLL